MRKAAGIESFDWPLFKVSISGVDYPVLHTEDGAPFIEADPASSYNAVLYREESAGYYGLSRYVGVVVPPAFFYHDFAKELDAMPLYASYCEEDGNVLKFSPLVAALKLTLSVDKGGGRGVNRRNRKLSGVQKSPVPHQGCSVRRTQLYQQGKRYKSL